jgi:hypothetical protein
VSGYAEDVVAKRGIISSDIEFLEKSMLNAELLKKVRDVLAKAAARQPSE